MPQNLLNPLSLIRMTERGVESKGGSLHDGFGGSGDSVESTLPPFAGLKNTGQRGNRDGFDGFGGYGGFGRDGYPS